MPLEILHPKLQACFLHCFNDGHQFPHKRPTAGDWVKVLELSLNDIVSCGKMDSHHYSASYGHCYWCDRARDLKFDLFPGNALVQVNTAPTPRVSPESPAKPISVGQKISLPKVSAPPKQLLQKWSRRKILAGLSLVTVSGVSSTAGIKIFAEPRYRKLTTQEFSPTTTPIVYSELTLFTEQLPDGVELEMVGLPGGTFLMGSPETDPDASDNEFPQHEVEVRSFAIGKYPVTQDQWQAVMGDNPSYFSSDPKNPVEQVTWDDCQKFCRELYQLTNKNYRLPSEAEWEYACRAGTTTRYFFGNDAAQLGDYAWYDDNSEDKTHPVGLKKPNPWGLYDMHGNVWEWCEDGWHRSYQGAPVNGSAWTDNQGLSGRCVLRGGSWLLRAGNCRSARRSPNNVLNKDFSRGFRLILE
jgi:formylglycine-generating enzyme required for sulfatase activity